VTLYYQTVSKEYVEFLRDENVTNAAGLDFYNLWSANGKSAPEIMNSLEWSVVREWTGAVSSDWHNPLNWSGGIPNEALNVVISASAPNQPVITSNAVCDHLTIESGAQLILANGAMLTLGSQSVNSHPGGTEPLIRMIFGGRIAEGN
jgi:hypothetical protein